jgi:hypothetical protein
VTKASIQTTAEQCGLEIESIEATFLDCLDERTLQLITDRIIQRHFYEQGWSRSVARCMVRWVRFHPILLASGGAALSHISFSHPSSFFIRATESLMISTAIIFFYTKKDLSNQGLPMSISLNV